MDHAPVGVNVAAVQVKELSVYLARLGGVVTSCRQAMGEPNWRREGAEPDYRFTLANERTFLAWIRTALALLAGGVLLLQFAHQLGPRVPVLVLALSLCLLAAVLCGMAYAHWRDNEIAMRHARPLPHSRLIPLLSASLLLLGGVLLATIWLS